MGGPEHLSRELEDEPLVDYAALDRHDVLAEVSRSIKWLSMLRDMRPINPGVGLAALRVQVALVEQYRLLLLAVETDKRQEQGERAMGLLRGDLERFYDGGA